MAKKLTFKFDPNQEHQKFAFQSVVDLFDGLSRNDIGWEMGEEIVPNLPSHQQLDELWLRDNLNNIRERNGFTRQFQLDADEGLVNDWLGIDSWRYPAFTIEMETGTGKTYVYLRTIYELNKKYGFKKYIIVVPSVAIYEGVIKSFEMTRNHFRSLYHNEPIVLIEYDSKQISKLRNFSTESGIQILVMTIDSFNKKSNNLFKTTEKLPGEKLPYQYIQETRPVLILDESQNYRSVKAKAALRSLHPLFALNYSATPIDKPNLLYKLSPVDAFKMGLVKRIQVVGVEEMYNVNDPQLALQLHSINERSYGLVGKATVKVLEDGIMNFKEIELRKNDDLFAKTHNENFKGIVVDEVNIGNGIIVFSNGNTMSIHDSIYTTPQREELFRTQIKETIRYHFTTQSFLKSRGIKVLSLFFIDRVANYTDDDGVVKKLFDEEFNKLKVDYGDFKDLNPDEVREAYFAKKTTKAGDEIIETHIEDKDKTKADKEAEKDAYRLIMKEKERILSFEEKKCFIFAHSALKEGWDNPNVFQICTLNNTVSETKKRQEIGRGLRLCVKQNGARDVEEMVNVLTVIPNESYESYASNLQREYIETGDMEYPKPTRATLGDTKRNEKIFKSKDFKNFWKKLNIKTDYSINIKTTDLIKECEARFKTKQFPQPQIVITKGKFIITDFTLRLGEVVGERAKIEIIIKDTDGQEKTTKQNFSVGNNLARIVDNRMKGYKIVDIVNDGVDSKVVFGDENIPALTVGSEISFQSEKGQQVSERTAEDAQSDYPVFNIIERASKELGLTRSTLLKIFKGISKKKKENIFKNPEGFSGVYITVIKECLSDHIADGIEYKINKDLDLVELEKIFPPVRKHAQKEMINGSKSSLYDQIQIDSDVEKNFVENRLKIDDENEKMICYFKFPMTFKISIPKIIGNYNPDWGAIRLSEDGNIKLELVRETKGDINPNLLQFPNEKRKIDCAIKHFDTVGLDYRQVTAETLYWWENEDRQEEVDVSVE